MFDQLSYAALAALSGLFGGVLLGLAARLGRFCTMGAIEDSLYANSDTRLRMWGIAIGVAITGTFLLAAYGPFDPSLSIYHLASFSPLFAILGGLVFGYGMALAGNCGYGALARLGGGDLRAFVIVLVMGITALMTVSGPFARIRLSLIEATSVSTSPQGYAELLGNAIGIPAAAVGVAVGLVLIATTLVSRDFRHNGLALFWGVVVGLAVVSGWGLTGWLHERSFAAVSVASHTFSAPVGDTIIFLMTSSGGGLGFGVGSVAGVIVGAFIGSLIKGHFRWEACEDPRELRRQIWGAAMMGVGAVFALGCSVGQGISAMSVLAYSAPLVLAGIFIGAALGLRRLIEGAYGIG